MVQTIPLGLEANPVSLRVVNACPAQGMGPQERQTLALEALGGTFTITALAEQAEVSRKFVHQQIDIAQQALEQAFATPAADDDEILFHLPVTKKWLRMNVVSLLPIAAVASAASATTCTTAAAAMCPSAPSTTSSTS